MDTSKKLVAIVDEAIKLNKEIQVATKRLDEIKTKIKEAAAETGKREFVGTLGRMQVINSTSWSVKFSDLVEWLKRNKKKDLLELFVTVKHGEIKSKLGEAVLAEIGEKVEKGQSIRFGL